MRPATPPAYGPSVKPRAAVLALAAGCISFANVPAARTAAPPVVPEISISDASVVEGTGGVTFLTFAVSLSEPSSMPVSAVVASADGTATAGADYTSFRSTFEFLPGTTGPATAQVRVTGDLIDEPDETLTLTLSNVVNATVADAQGVGTIIDDDEPDDAPAISISDGSIVEGDDGSTFLAFQVGLSKPAPVSVSMRLRSADGTATSPDDFLSTDQQLDFLTGTMGPVSILVRVYGDEIGEADETFTLVASSPLNASIRDGQGVGTIIDDDDDGAPTTVAVTTPTTAPGAPTTQPSGPTTDAPTPTVPATSPPPTSPPPTTTAVAATLPATW